MTWVALLTQKEECYDHHGDDRGEVFVEKWVEENCQCQFQLHGHTIEPHNVEESYNLKGQVAWPAGFCLFYFIFFSFFYA